MKPRHFFVGLILMASLPGSATATTVYDFSSTPEEIDCRNALHGLWTNLAFEGTCANYFSISTALRDEGGVSASFIDPVVNPERQIADINWGLNLQLTRQVPEPGGLALLGAATLAFGALRLLRRQQNSDDRTL